MQIAVYAIALNEEKHVERFCEAAKDADLIFIADTGSTDQTVPLLMEWRTRHPTRVAIKSISIKPWRFDDARNAALAMLPGDIDVCVSLDLDEVLQPGWRQEIERVWVPGTTRLRYGFDWGAGIAFQYEKIHGRYGYRWHHPCHEFPVPDRITEVWAETQQLLVVHQADNTKSRSQYMDLLRVSVEEDPQCPRNAFYYGRELRSYGQFDEAIKQLTRYLALPRATWANERCYAMRMLAEAHRGLKNWAAALDWARRACSESEHTREPWCLLAELCYETSRWAECFGAAMTCLYVTNREKVYSMDPSVWGWKAHDYVSISAYNLGMHDVAVEHAEKCVEMEPGDLRLRQNLEFCRKAAAA